MQVIYPRCAGLDVHEKTVVATVMVTQDDGQVQKMQRTFRTMTADLLALDDWLEQQQIKVIAMESTGIFWRAVFTILETGRTVIRNVVIALLTLSSFHHFGNWAHRHLGECSPYEGGSWAQDRCQGQRVDCRFITSWSHEMRNEVSSSKEARKSPLMK